MKIRSMLLTSVLKGKEAQRRIKMNLAATRAYLSKIQISTLLATWRLMVLVETVALWLQESKLSTATSRSKATY